MLVIKYKNSLEAYLGLFVNVMINTHTKGMSSSKWRTPQPLQSLIRHDLNLCLMLELFEDRLTRFEKSLKGEKANFDYGTYPEAMCFLDAIYFFSRMLLDSTAGIIRHYYNLNNRGYELDKSFDALCKKSAKGELPDNLNKVFSGCEKWFPQLKDRRDNIVHHYETYLIGLGNNIEGQTIAVQFSPYRNNHVRADEDLRSYIGMAMAGYQHFVDKLLDWLDEMFKGWDKMTSACCFSDNMTWQQIGIRCFDPG